MEKINTDYKRRIKKIEAKPFNMSKTVTELLYAIKNSLKAGELISPLFFVCTHTTI